MIYIYNWKKYNKMLRKMGVKRKKRIESKHLVKPNISAFYDQNLNHIFIVKLNQEAMNGYRDHHMAISRTCENWRENIVSFVTTIINHEELHYAFHKMWESDGFILLDYLDHKKGG